MKLVQSSLVFKSWGVAKLQKQKIERQTDRKKEKEKRSSRNYCLQQQQIISNSQFQFLSFPLDANKLT